MAVMQFIHQHRRHTAAEWSTINPVLLQAEPGWEIDGRKGKVGNGVDTWNDLPYSWGDGLSAGPGTIDLATATGLLDVSKISGLTPMFADYVTIDTAQTIYGQKTFNNIASFPSSSIPVETINGLDVAIDNAIIAHGGGGGGGGNVYVVRNTAATWPSRPTADPDTLVIWQAISSDATTPTVGGSGAKTGDEYIPWIDV